MMNPASSRDKRMNDIERNLKGSALGSVYLAADGSGNSGTPRDDEPQRNGLPLGEMLEMGLESLLMHFRRKPDSSVVPHGRSKNNRADDNGVDGED